MLELQRIATDLDPIHREMVFHILTESTEVERYIVTLNPHDHARYKCPENVTPSDTLLRTFFHVAMPCHVLVSCSCRAP